MRLALASGLYKGPARLEVNYKPRRNLLKLRNIPDDLGAVKRYLKRPGLQGEGANTYQTSYRRRTHSPPSDGNLAIAGWNPPYAEKTRIKPGAILPFR